MKHKSVDLDAPGNKGSTALHYAAYNDSADCAKILVSYASMLVGYVKILVGYAMILYVKILVGYASILVGYVKILVVMQSVW